MENLTRRLNAHALVGLDTSIWIYHLEANERYLGLTTQILEAALTGRPRVVISVITLMELTVRPYKLNQPTVATHYEAVLTNFPHALLVDIDPAIARRAAQLRAAYSLQAADALHIATSLVAGATAWVTNDRGLSRLSPYIDVIILNDILGQSGEG